MEERAHAFTAGLFVLLLGLGAALALWWFSSDREGVARYLLVSEGNITGLNEQAQVRFRGIRAGKVEAIDIDPANPRQILVRISLRKDLPVTRGTRASLGYQGVTGIAFVQLTDSGEDPAPLPPGPDGLPRLTIQPGLVEQLSDSGLETLRKIQAVMDRLGGGLNEANLARVTRTLERLESASAGVDRTFQEAPRAVAAVRELLSPENLARVHHSLAHLEAASAEAAPAVRELRALAVKLQGVGDRVDGLAARADHQLVQGAGPRLETLLAELTTTSRRMTELLEALEASPQILLFGRGAPPPGPGEAGYPTSSPARE